MVARVESQSGGADDGAAPSIPSAFKNDHMLGATEAIMWIACRRRFSHETIRKNLERHRDCGQWRYGRSQLNRPLQRRADKAERQLIGLIIGGVPATGTLDCEGDSDHEKRVPVPVEFLKDGAYIELLSGHIRADPLLEKHFGYQRPTYRDVDIDRNAFFKALAAAEPASTRRRAVLPRGPPAEVPLDFWTPEQIAKFIKIKDAFEEFCERDPDLSDLDSIRPDPKCNAEDFEKWYARYCLIHDIAAKRFAGLFREKVLVGMGLEPYDNKEIVLPPEYWAITEDVSTDSEVDHAPHEGEGFASLMVMKKMVQGISPEVPRHLEYYHVLRRVDWEKWITGAAADSQQVPQEPAETPVPEESEDKFTQGDTRETEQDARRSDVTPPLAPVNAETTDIEALYAQRVKDHRAKTGRRPTFEADNEWRKDKNLKRDALRDLRQKNRTDKEKKGGHPPRS